MDADQRRWCHYKNIYSIYWWLGQQPSEQNHSPSSLNPSVLRKVAPQLGQFFCISYGLPGEEWGTCPCRFHCRSTFHRSGTHRTRLACSIRNSLLLALLPAETSSAWEQWCTLHLAPTVPPLLILAVPAGSTHSKAKEFVLQRSCWRLPRRSQTPLSGRFTGEERPLLPSCPSACRTPPWSSLEFSPGGPPSRPTLPNAPSPHLTEKSATSEGFEVLDACLRESGQILLNIVFFEEFLEGLLLDECLDVHFGLEEVVLQQVLPNCRLFLGLFQKSGDLCGIALLLRLLLLLQLAHWIEQYLRTPSKALLPVTFFWLMPNCACTCFCSSNICLA